MSVGRTTTGLPGNTLLPRYTVRAGDTLGDIAVRHGVTLTALMAANPHVVDPNLVRPGMTLSLPAAGATPPPAVPAARHDTFTTTTGTTGIPAGAIVMNLALTGPDRIIDYTARNEGQGRYDAWNPNDAGSGVSFGLIQFNQEVGELPTLFRRMHEMAPTRFRELMGPHADNLLNESWVRDADLNAPDIKRRIIASGGEPVFQQAQRNVARRSFYDPVVAMASNHGLASQRALALLFDSAVQNGVNGTRGMLERAAAVGGSEMDILTRLARVADAVTGGNQRRTRILRDQALSDQPA